MSTPEPNPAVLQLFTDLNANMHKVMKEERRIFLATKEREEAEYNSAKAKKEKRKKSRD